jgi:Fe-S-cluster-containing dehydrogenase component
MKIKRRDFLKGAAGCGVLAAVGQPTFAEAKKKERLPGALGFLYDSTLCIGCQACMVGCKKANNMPVESSDLLPIWENPRDLSAKTLNVIKKFENGTGTNKDQEVDGFAFVKRQCMHCVDPGCVSACPVSAMRKNPDTGVVTYNKDACIGCRYCQIACPFNIPKFQWDAAFPQIVKCQLCSHLLQKGEIAACCSSCPTGASLFGPTNDLLAEANRRQQMEPGKYYDYPVASIDSGMTLSQQAPSYVQQIYGESEVGGTQVLMLAGVPFSKLGFPELPDKSYASTAETIQHTLYKGMIAPVIVLAGLFYFVNRSQKDKD